MDDNPPKLYGSERESAAPGPSDFSSEGSPRVRFWAKRGFKRFTSVAVLLFVIAACIAGYTRANSYGNRIVQARPVDARIEILNPPSWLDRRIVASLLDEAYQFAQKDDATYQRARNTLDAGILREFADLYTGAAAASDAATAPAPHSRQAIGYNAWIRKVVEVRREIAPDKSVQTIQISAEWRVPAAWIRVKDMLCLIDADGTRLPGDYRLEDRPRSRLQVLAGLDFPRAGQPIPQPGEIWTAAPGAPLAADLAAGLELINTIKRQPFAQQIHEIDMSNHAGRVNAQTAWIVFNTIFKLPPNGGTAGAVPALPALPSPPAPTRVEWGRPIGQEKYYEVHATAKVKALNELFTRFSRIDAGREYVDIRTEVLRLPKLASASN
jgi:hypothetical protein